MYRAFRSLCAAVAIAGVAGALVLRPPLQQWSVWALVMAVVVWALAATGRFFFGGDRAAPIQPRDVQAARWLEGPRRVLALTLRDGTTAIVDDPDMALAMAVALRDRGIEVKDSQA